MKSPQTEKLLLDFARTRPVKAGRWDGRGKWHGQGVLKKSPQVLEVHVRDDKSKEIELWWVPEHISLKELQSRLKRPTHVLQLVTSSGTVIVSAGTYRLTHVGAEFHFVPA